MPVKFQFTDQRLRAWVLCRQVYSSIFRCEDVVFSKVGLSSQKHAILMAINYIHGPATVSGVANWIDRTPNGVSMIVDRMVKDGLVERLSDLPDRRAVRLVITKKGKAIFKQATMLGWGLIQEVLSSLTDEEISTLNSLFDKVRGKAFEYLNPGKGLKEVKTSEAKDMPRFLAEMAQHQSLG
jgi:DNA-binding MarR family transcriptional regulator